MHDPYKVLKSLETRLQISSAGDYQEKTRRIWRAVTSFWNETRSRDDMKAYFRLVRGLLGEALRSVLHESHKRGSRARWLCTLKTGLRLVAGVTCLCLFGLRRHLGHILRLGPAQLHLTAGLIQANQGEWNPCFGRGLKEYFENIERWAWDPPVEAEKGWSVSYTRFSQVHRRPYAGWDRVFRYATGWPAFVERDWLHDVTAWKQGCEDYDTVRSKYYRRFPAASLYVLINAVADPVETKLREDFSLVKYRFPLPQRPRRSRGISFTPRRRPLPWKRRRPREWSVLLSLQYNYDCLVRKRKLGADKMAEVDNTWTSLRFNKAMQQEYARRRLEGISGKINLWGGANDFLAALFLAEKSGSCNPVVFAHFEAGRQRERWLREDNRR